MTPHRRHATSAGERAAKAAPPATTSTPTQEITISAELAGQRLDRALTEVLPGSSRTRVQTAIRAGEVRVNGRVGRSGQVVEAGQRITLALTAHDATATGPAGPQPEALPLQIVYEDDHLIVIDKPAGLVMHPAPGHPTGTLVNALLAHIPGLDQATATESDDVAEAGEGDEHEEGIHWPEERGTVRPGIVHRLDKDTSGLLVVAKDATTHAALAQQMRERRAVKRYLALIEGHLPVSEGSVDAPIGRDLRQRQRMALVSTARGGREARTRFRVLREGRGRSFVELQLETGRTHQIRVHMAAVGHPIVGDPVYGHPQPPQPPRQFLHAAHLEFEHPVTGAWLTFDAPLPPDLSAFLSAWEAS